MTARVPEKLVHPELKRLIKQVGPRTRRSIDGSYWRLRYAEALRRFRNGRNAVG